ncbi:MAG: SH3 domain-containing protein [Caldilineaceae bacterium]
MLRKDVIQSSKDVERNAYRQRGHRRAHRQLVFLSLLLALGLLTLTLLPASQMSSYLYAQSAEGRLAVVGAQGATLVETPGGAALETLKAGATLTAVGRTADNLWVVVKTDKNVTGWVATQEIVIFGAEQLPVMLEAPATQPAATPTGASATAQATASEPTASEPTVAPPTPTSEPPTATPTTPPTPTATPSPTPPPTATATPAPSPTSTATSLLGPQSEIIAVVGSAGATLMDAPAGATLRTLSTGTALSATGRNSDGSALFVQTATNESGWVDATKVVAFNVQSLPVREGEASAASNEAAQPSAETNAGEPAMAASAVVTNTVAVSPTAVAPSATSPLTPTVTTTPLPTATPTQAMRSTPVADGRPTAQVAMSGSRLNVRSGPGTDFPVIAKALPREVFIVRARNGDSSWVQLEVPDISGGFGWVSTTFVEVSVPISELPISLETNDTAAPNSPAIAEALRTRSIGSTTAAGTTGAATASSAGATTTTVANTAQGSGPTGLSGRLVIQSVWGGTFYLYDLASGALRALSGGFDPALSPDSSEIAFTRIGNENGIYLINADGSDERKIFGERDGLMSPKWSPDGDWIVFSRNDGFYKCRELGFGICLSDAQILQMFFGNNPVPDAVKHQVLKNFDEVQKGEWMIARVDAQGDEYRDLPALNSARAPDWNENGIVYQSAGGLQITEDKPDGDTRVVYNDGYKWDPDWQPGGGRIVFQSREGPHWEIFAINPDGSGLVALTRPATTLVDQLPSNVAPVWSPDGNYIAFLSNRDANNAAGAWRVWVMNADGSNQRPLPINLPITYNYASEQMISWGR